MLSVRNCVNFFCLKLCQIFPLIYLEGRNRVPIVPNPLDFEELRRHAQSNIQLCFFDLKKKPKNLTWVKFISPNTGYNDKVTVFVAFCNKIFAMLNRSAIYLNDFQNYQIQFLTVRLCSKFELQTVAKTFFWFENSTKWKALRWGKWKSTKNFIIKISNFHKSHTHCHGNIKRRLSSVILHI